MLRFTSVKYLKENADIYQNQLKVSPFISRRVSKKKKKNNNNKRKAKHVISHPIIVGFDVRWVHCHDGTSACSSLVS